jgi:type I restriction enzyme, R subunit
VTKWTWELAEAVYQAETKFADYVLFVDQKPVGIIEAKKEDEGHKLTIAEEQAKEYSVAKLKYLVVV